MSDLPLDASKFGLIGVPSSAGARQVGQELAPRQLRSLGLVERLRSVGYDVVDLGDVPETAYVPDRRNPTQQNLPLVLRVVEQTEAAVQAAIARRARPLVIGGDCTVTIGVVAALTAAFPNLGVIYFDGDVDLNTPETTSSGIFDGMVLAHLLGWGAQALSHRGSRYPLLEEDTVTLFGYSVRAGGIDPVELDLLRSVRMPRHPLEAIERRPRDAAVRALRELENTVEHILVHFDVDVIDARDFPAVDVQHHPGLSLRDARDALQVFLTSPKVVGLVVTEFNAGHDAGGTLARRLTDLLREALMR